MPEQPNSFHRMNRLFYSDLEELFLQDNQDFWNDSCSELVIAPFDMTKHVKIVTKAVDDYNSSEWSKFKSQADLHEDYAEELLLASDLVKNSLFSSAYGIIESNMGMLCKFHESHHTLRPKDLFGSGLVRSIDYLEKVVGFKLRHLSDWPVVDDARIIRNAIAHSSANLEEFSEKARVKKIVQNCDNYKLSGDFLSVESDATLALLYSGIRLIVSAVNQRKGLKLA